MRGRACFPSWPSLRPLLAAYLFAAPARAAECARPTDAEGALGYSYGGATVHTYDRDRVRVFFSRTGPHAAQGESRRTDGVPDDVALVGDVAEDALRAFAAMGFRAPLPDDAPGCASNGGDGRLDVYLVRFASADGTAVPERCNDPEETSPAAAPRACTSFVLAAADLAERYGGAEEGVRTVLPHEIFHAVQHAYRADLDRSWAEGTAQWAAKTLSPSLRDFERFLPAFLEVDPRPLDLPPSGVTSGYLYGSAIWPLFLSLRHDGGLIREILEEQAREEAPSSTLRAAARALEARGDTFADAWQAFWEWNTSTGSRAGDGGYPDAAAYPEIPVRELDERAEDATAGTMAHVHHLRGDGPRLVQLGPSTSAHRATLLPVEGGRVRLDRAAPLPATADAEAYVVVTSSDESKRDATYRLEASLVPVAGATPGAAGGSCGVALPERRRDPRATLALATAYVLFWRLLRAVVRRSRERV